MRVQWNRAILLAEDPRLVDEGPRPKSGTIFKGKSTGLELLKMSSKESSWFGEPRCKLGSKAWYNSSIQLASNGSKLVPKNLDPGPHLKWAFNPLRGPGWYEGWKRTQDQAGMKFLHTPNTQTRASMFKSQYQTNTLQVIFTLLHVLLVYSFSKFHHPQWPSTTRRVLLLNKCFFRKFAVGENWKKVLSSEGVMATLGRKWPEATRTFSRLSLIVFIQKKAYVPPPPCPISAIWFKAILTKLAPIWSLPQPTKWMAGAKSRSFKFKFGGGPEL
jgi:hypothetical protein